MNNPSENCPTDALRGRRVAAGVLLAIAALALLGRYLPLGAEDGVTLLLGAGFIVWAALCQRPALLIPGGILAGIGAGLLLRFEHGDAVFLFSMAGGFLLITALNFLLFKRWVRWPFFPAAGLAFSGATQLADADWQHWIREHGPLWPYGLIVLAAYLLLTKPRVKS